jgi:uncharacterized protein (DUF1501 family)
MTYIENFGSIENYASVASDNGSNDELVESVAHQFANRGRVSRRDFLKIAGLIGGGQLLATQLGPLRRALSAGASTSEDIVVLIYLGGGNDGLNTAVPLGAQYSTYRDLRPQIGVANPLVLTDDTGLHPSLTNLAARYKLGQVAVLRNVGYNPPNQSHFTSTDYWAQGYGTGDPANTALLKSGWLGRWFDDARTGNPFQMIGVGGVPLYLKGNSDAALGLPIYSRPAIGFQATNADEVRLGTAYRAMSAQQTGFGRLGDTLASLNSRAYTAAGQLAPAYVDLPGGNNYLLPQLYISANIINANLGARVFTVQIGGFDTHSAQLGTHPDLLSFVDQAIESFLLRLDPVQRAKVSVLTWSEFGRSPKENDSGGTDHGTASVMFAVGEPVAGGMYGTPYDLSKRDADGDIYATTDFRRVYASVVRGILGADDTRVLGGTNDPIPFLKTLQSTPPTTTTTTNVVTTTAVAATTTAPTTTTIVATTTTGATTTAPPTTAPATTAPPTTAPPTTAPATTAPPTTAPTTKAPTFTTAPTSTASPTSTEPKTVPPTTAAPTTAAPTTAPPTTAPKTVPPTTAAPTTTLAPASTLAPVPTEAPTTVPPTTALPTTAAPTTTEKPVPTTTISTPTTTRLRRRRRPIPTTITTTTKPPRQKRRLRR